MSAFFPRDAAPSEHDRARASAALGRAFHDAKEAFPTVALPMEAFYAHLGEKFQAAEAAVDVEAWLATRSTRELYLACACAAGDAAAIALCEKMFFDQVFAAIARLRKSGHDADDVAQLVRQRAFLAEPGQRPKIAEYSGQGSLGAWLRVVATRVALNHGRNLDDQPHAPEDELEALAAPATDAELALVKSRYRAAFRDALVEGLAALSARDRNLLRHHYCDGLTLIEVGAIHRVHRVTAARWIDEARAKLFAATRAALLRRCVLSDAELASIVRVMRSDLTLSLGELLR